MNNKINGLRLLTSQPFSTSMVTLPVKYNNYLVSLFVHRDIKVRGK